MNEIHVLYVRIPIDLYADVHNLNYVVYYYVMWIYCTFSNFNRLMHMYDVV